MKFNEILSKKGYFTNENYSFIIKPNISTLGSIIENKLIFSGSERSFVHDDSIRDLWGFNSVVLYEK